MKSKKKSRMSKVHTQLLSFKFDNKNNAINDSKKSMSYDFGKIPKGLYKKLIQKVYQHMKIEPEDEFVTDTIYVKDSITKKGHKSNFVAKKISQDSSLMVPSKFTWGVPPVIMTMLYFTKVPNNLENAYISIYKRVRLPKNKFILFANYNYVLTHKLPIKENYVYVIKPNTYYGFPNLHLSSDSNKTQSNLEYLYSFCQYV